MTDTKMLIGSLSNDLLRVASLTQRGSDKAAQKFLLESKKWSRNLANKNLKNYIKKIILEINSDDQTISIEKAEKYLMFSVLLQNYSLKIN